MLFAISLIKSVSTPVSSSLILPFEMKTFCFVFLPKKVGEMQRKHIHNTIGVFISTESQLQFSIRWYWKEIVYSIFTEDFLRLNPQWVISKREFVTVKVFAPAFLSASQIGLHKAVCLLNTFFVLLLRVSTASQYFLLACSTVFSKKFFLIAFFSTLLLTEYFRKIKSFSFFPLRCKCRLNVSLKISLNFLKSSSGGSWRN